MKPTPEAAAFRAKIDAEGPDWPDDLKRAAVFLRCELDNVPYKGWADTGGRKRLFEYAETFARLYAEWQGKETVRVIDMQQWEIDRLTHRAETFTQAMLRAMPVRERELMLRQIDKFLAQSAPPLSAE